MKPFKGRFCAWYHQIEEALTSAPGKVLEIGKGEGLVSDYLKKKGVAVTTLDTDRAKAPDVVASVLKMPFADGSFDVVLCCEVLEHLPYSAFGVALTEVYRIARSRVVLSLPDATRVYYLQLLPRGWLVRIPLHWSSSCRKKSGLNPWHHWEIGKPVRLKEVRQAVNKAGFRIERTYRVLEMPYNRFFILSKCR